MNRQRFVAGDKVIVRSPDEIAQTLDADGTLDGLPFMPEMIEWCGKASRVERRVEKACVDVGRTNYSPRHFAGNDVVVLVKSRCDGRSHDSCDRRCKILWKEAWLESGGGHAVQDEVSHHSLDELQSRLKTRIDDTHYFCQSAQLKKATVEYPGRKKPWLARILYQEIRNGDRSLGEVLKLIVLWVGQRLRRIVSGDGYLRGLNIRTPSESLGLSPGDSVRIKSRSQIVTTLDNNRRNRGMSICHEMTRYCGGVAEVRDRVDRIIDERTGRMVDMSDSVILKNIRAKGLQRNEECLCYDSLGDCPRGELMYWREIWLERRNGRAP